MRIVQLDQRSQAWLDYRKQGLGASDIPAIMGINPFRKPIDVYNEKLSDKPNYVNAHMQRGIDHEEEALKQVQVLLGVELSPLCVEHDTLNWLRASLDGYNKERNIIVEIKTPSEKNYESQALKVDPMHYCQLQAQSLVTKSTECYLYVYSPETKSGSLKKIDVDYDYQLDILEKATDFWTNNVLKFIPPSCESSDLIEITHAVAFKSAERLSVILESKKLLEKEEKLIKKSLPEYSDGGNFRVGRIIGRMMEGRKTLDKEAMIKDGIDVSKYEKQGIAFWNITLEKA